MNESQSETYTRVFVTVPKSVGNSAYKQLVRYFVDTFDGCTFTELAGSLPMNGYWKNPATGVVGRELDVALIIADANPERLDVLEEGLAHAKSIIESNEELAWIASYPIRVNGILKSARFSDICEQIDKLRKIIKELSGPELVDYDKHSIIVKLTRVRNELSRKFANEIKLEIVRDRWEHIKERLSTTSLREMVEELSPKIITVIQEIQKGID